MSILKVEPSAINTDASFSFGDISTSGNITVGNAVIQSTAEGSIEFVTATGTVNLDANTVSFLSNVSTQGMSGSNGYVGSQGVPGFAGSAGTNGFTGSAGSSGTTGFTGSAGSAGTNGFTGSAGSNGFTGSAGAAGFVGSASAGGTGDTFFNNTSLLLHFDGTNGQTKTIDSSGAQTTLTFGSAAALSSTQAKFGTTSLLTNSSAGSSVTTTGVLQGSPLDLSTSGIDWTVELWAYPTALPSGTNEFQGVMLGWGPMGFGAGWAQISLYLGAGGNWAGQFNSNNTSAGTTDIGSLAAATLNTWTHLALARSGNTAYFFVNGQLQGTSTRVGNGINFSSGSWIMGRGTNDTYRYIGHIDEVRITKGVARYVTNFTPSNSAWPDFYSGIGYTGSQGTAGFTGSSGTNGFTGSAGTSGTNGFTGSAGSGFTGSAGTTGAIGFTGSVGFTGSAAPLNLPVVNRSTAYTLTATDVGDYVNITTGGVTVPAGVFSSGDVVSIYNNSASSQTITTTAVTCYLVGTATTGNRTLAQRGLATLLCVGTNEFVISGGGLT